MKCIGFGIACLCSSECLNDTDLHRGYAHSCLMRVVGILRSPTVDSRVNSVFPAEFDCDEHDFRAKQSQQRQCMSRIYQHIAAQCGFVGPAKDQLIA
jgi:hypothetical protein